MTYCSLDIETSGKDFEKHSILELGAIMDDLKNPRPINKLPKIDILIDHEKDIVVDDYCLNMHAESGLWKRRLKEKMVFHHIVMKKFSNWFREAKSKLSKHKAPLYYKPPHRTVWAGKNVGSFDIPFIQHNFSNFDEYFEQPVQEKKPVYMLDPAAYYVRPEDDDMPGLSTCKKRAGIKNTKVSHNALDDALDVIKLIRNHFNINYE